MVQNVTIYMKYTKKVVTYVSFSRRVETNRIPDLAVLPMYAHLPQKKYKELCKLHHIFREKPKI